MHKLNVLKFVSATFDLCKEVCKEELKIRDQKIEKLKEKLMNSYNTREETLSESMVSQR